MRSANQRLGLIAIVVALLALVAGNSFKRNTANVDPYKLAYIVEHELDHVSAFDLGKSIMEGNSHYLVLDLRDSNQFADYHIPGAVNISLTSLMDAKYQKDQPMVLYSEGGVHSAQAMFLMWTRGYSRVYMLKGGMNEWNDEVLHPVLHPGNVAGSDSIATLRKMSAWFGTTNPNKRLNENRRPDQNGGREQLRNEC